MRFLKYISAISIFWFLLSCEDTIFPELAAAEDVLVVDAWINNKPGPQIIKLSRSQPYFQNSLPPGVRGATVLVLDNEGQSFEFREAEKAGEYVWEPVNSGEAFGKIGNSYRLLIQWNGMELEAESRMNRVPAIDSISFYFEKGTFGGPDSWFSEFWVRDFVGTGDTYWARGWKNGQALNKPSEIVTAYDAGFSKGGNVDGIPFIAPIRRGLNPVDQNAQNEFLPSFMPGDSIYVELYSINEPAFDFLQQVRIQTDRAGGFGEFFAQPLANVPSNIRVKANTSDRKVTGFFNVAAVSKAGKRLRVN